MAAQKSKQNPHQWKDGTWHSITQAEHDSNVGLAKGFTPFAPPTSPPPGTYDPGLDASKRANDRGLLDLKQDTDLGNQRADTQHTASLAQLLRGRQRGEADLGAALARETADFGRNTETLQRNYSNLGLAQTARASQGAFVDTGSIAAGAGARQENQGRDQGELNLAHSRFGEDNTTARTRLGEDYDSGVTQADTEFQYGVDDRASTLARALREGNFFGQDTAAAKMYQATSSGLFTPPAKPANENTDAKGAYRLIVRHGLRYKQRANGTMEPAGVAGR